ncbi:MAG: hypothetical protein JNK46_16445 [Methylobacteriaceae bacterium]|nr:hypothetical protein [Methylobacteriaceae bacterium]
MFTPPRAAGAPAWLAGPARAEAQGSGFALCVAPSRPDCARRRDAPLSNAARKACEEDAARFVATVFAYRACLEAEISRAVREANETIAMARCGKASLTDCPPR